MSAPHSVVRDAVRRALREDLEPLGDLTASLLDDSAQGRLAIATRQRGVIAGQDCVVETFWQLDPSIEVEVLADDGSLVEPGELVTRISGPLAPILTGERTALNFLGHLSGVATQTRAMVDAVAAVSSTTRVLDTRKTTPGLRSLEKAAVRAGGGTNHRANLSDAILIKDNHLGSMTIAEAISRAKASWPGRNVEVECDTLAQLEEAAKAGATSVLLDNMSPEQALEATKLARSLAPSMLVEVSGGVTLESAADYARAGVDLISSGALTHSVRCLDLGLDLSTETTGRR
jgi:nicotinate-nucleotide pyrophosphorylase (carboxylating)